MTAPRTSSRGFSKTELVMALSLLTLAAAGVILIARPSLAKNGDPLVELAAPLVAAASEWHTANPSDCPTVGLLIEDGYLDANVSREDPWGGVFRVQCRDGQLFIHSDGEDQKPGTADDRRADVH